ncbi:asparagine synthase (glutamine-hydrolyzing) [Anaerosporobacter faecicola]|uniref:asparagine synthase (glutamine-hydrolyzing) n=1 Tax=Anaerosporobacter faecicola TaxID=2718714 RepID=UPI00143CBFEA|nr:asparagine synthase (glutamine-hydrolyzing) [Anaerosporobacter faecicola]
MCGIAGFCNFDENYSCSQNKYIKILKKMATQLHRRGPDARGHYLSKHFGLAHARLSIIDLAAGTQPMYRTVDGYTYAISYNGELYNTEELRRELSMKGWHFYTHSDTEVILIGHIQYGPAFVEKMNGIFAYAFVNEKEQSITLYRDRCGVKPLFYTIFQGVLLFGSEMKAIFQYPGYVPCLDSKGLNEIFSIGPAKTSGSGIFKDMNELLPGHYLYYTEGTCKQTCYWKLNSLPHTDCYEDTIEKTRSLVIDSIKRQMVSDVPICTFLSGGVDSSLVSAVCNKELQKQGKVLQTYSFDFVNNEQYFQSNPYQPASDKPYVTQMVHYLGSNHTYLECDNYTMADCLYDSVDARDLPAMADIDSSMLHFCHQVKEHNKVTLTGECADEIFGGYPWFHKQECFDANTFPWSMDLTIRKSVLSDSFLSELNMDDYVNHAYQTSLAQTPRLAEDTKEEARRREIAYLNLRWFMQTLLDRMDRTSMYSGLEARVPFADHRIIEYVWNVPWSMKYRNGIAKNLLREAGRGLLPDEILFRKKSPYPKTYDPAYEQLLRHRIIEVIEDSTSPIMQFLDKTKVYIFLNSPFHYEQPWYGQLMAGPQMIAYLLQINYWLKKYHIQILS